MAKRPNITAEDCESYASQLIHAYKIKTIIGSDEKHDELWVYDGGYYHRDGKGFLKSMILSHAISKMSEEGSIRLPFKNNDCTQTISYIGARANRIYPSEIKQVPDCCNVENGIVDYSSNKVIFISRFEDDGREKDFSDYNFTYKLPVFYDPKATCTEIDKILAGILIDRNGKEPEEKHEKIEEDELAEEFFKMQELESESVFQSALEAGLIDEVRPKITGENSEKITRFHEVLGHMMMTDSYPIKKAHIYVGENHTGKTTIENIITQFIGEINRSTVQITDLDRGENRFMGDKLRHKIANVSDEMPSVSSKNMNIFMAATGSGFFSVEGKGKESTEMRNTAKFFHTANDLPKLGDTIKYRVYERLIIEELNNVFPIGAKGITNTKMVSRKYSKEEMSGLLNHAIDGLNRIIKNGMFTYDSDLTPTLYEKHHGRKNTLYEYVFGSGLYGIVNDKNTFVFIDQMHKEYVARCIMNNETYLPINMFSSELSKLDIVTIDKRTDVKRSEEEGKQVQHKAVIGLKKIISTIL